MVIMPLYVHVYLISICKLSIICITLRVDMLSLPQMGMVLLRWQVGLIANV